MAILLARLKIIMTLRRSPSLLTLYPKCNLSQWMSKINLKKTKRGSTESLILKRCQAQTLSWATCMMRNCRKHINSEQMCNKMGWNSSKKTKSKQISKTIIRIDLSWEMLHLTLKRVRRIRRSTRLRARMHCTKTRAVATSKKNLLRGLTLRFWRVDRSLILCSMMMVKEAPNLMKKEVKVNQMIKLRRKRRMKTGRITQVLPLINQEICRLSSKSLKSSVWRRISF